MHPEVTQCPIQRVKLKEGRFSLGIRKKFFIKRVARPWLPRGNVGAPSLAAPRARLDGAGGSLGWRQGSCPWQGLEQGGL